MKSSFAEWTQRYAGGEREALPAARASTIITVEPRVERREEGSVLCIPAEADYDVTEEPIANTR